MAGHPTNDVLFLPKQKLYHIIMAVFKGFPNIPLGPQNTLRVATRQHWRQPRKTLCVPYPQETHLCCMLCDAHVGKWRPQGSKLRWQAKQRLHIFALLYCMVIWFRQHLLTVQVLQDLSQSQCLCVPEISKHFGYFLKPFV